MDVLRVCVIMAGGAGERFWPVSRRLRPKQLLNLTSPDHTLLEESIDRILPLIPPERIWIATARSLVEPIRQARTGVPDRNVIGEPCKRNTAGCLAYAAACLLARYPDRVPEGLSMAVLTADHRIDPAQQFRRTVEAALEAAERDGALVTIGVVPTRAETGFGYIEVPQDAAPLAGPARGLPPVYPVARFREKPDPATAEEYVRAGRFLWNSGMFFWRLDRFMAELGAASPAHAEAIPVMVGALKADDEPAAEQVFERLPDISVDFALMEKAERVATARAEFHWDDVGAWDALNRGWPRDAAGNVTRGDPVLVDAHNCIVYNDPGAARTAVAAIGVEDLIIVVTNDGVLVTPKGRAQDVKQAVAELKARGAEQV